MFRKYSAKFNPTVIGTRFTDVKDVALERAQEGLNAVATIRELVKPILESKGIAGGQKATYLAFATALLRHVLRNKGQSAINIAHGLKSYYVTAYGLDPAVLDDIIQVVVGWAPPY